MTHQADVAIIGGGIIGLATARALCRRRPDLSITVVEAERSVSMHQSGHNSGVLHSGLYYVPGSEKARCCREGKAAMEAFCDEHSIAWQRCGKVVVATSAQELLRLDGIAERAALNGVDFRRINTDELREREPAAAGLAALHVPETGIVDYRQVCHAMTESIRTQRGSLRLQFDVQSIQSGGDSSLRLVSRHGETIDCGFLINCGGLWSDRIYRLCGGQADVQIVPFRGEYYELTPEKQSLCRNLIYPVPDPEFPFLGVHFTRMIGGGVECGPNAVLALSRAGYRWSKINLRDVGETAAFGGFCKLAAKHWRMGLGEIHRSLSKYAFARALQKLIPSLQADDLQPGRSGVRAQAITADGNLVDDFLFANTPQAIHVLNAPSPAATAALAIAERIVDRFEQDAR